VNYLLVNPDQDFRDSEVGFNGYGIGVEYHYKERKFIGLSSSYVMTFEYPVPIPADAEYNKILSSFSIDLTDNFHVNRFTFGYGLCYSAISWKEWIRDFDQVGLPTTSSKTFTNRNLGFTLRSDYKLGKTIHIGLIYQPSIVNLNIEPKFIYEHVISVEVNWRIKLFNAQTLGERSE
jgi:hypothetical protein